MSRRTESSHYGIAPSKVASHDRTTNQFDTSHKATTVHVNKCVLAGLHWGSAGTVRDCEHWHANRDNKVRASARKRPD